MKLRRGNIVLCKVPKPSEELREFKLRPGLIVSKDLNNKRLDDVIAVDHFCNQMDTEAHPR